MSRPPRTSGAPGRATRRRRRPVPVRAVAASAQKTPANPHLPAFLTLC